MPDGWERSHGLDALDDGVAGHFAMGNGRAGNPDGDTIDSNGTPQPYTNIQEFLNNTDPRAPDTGTPPAPGSITIGQRAPITGTRRC